MKQIIFISIIFSAMFTHAQYAPPVGQIGTTAIDKDSSIITNWASEIVAFKPGYLDIASPSNGLVSFGDSLNALGQAEGTSTDVVSLGDSGSITLTFTNPIKNGTGFDFAIFENSFSDDYLELAHIEVSTDGITFVRFPSISLTDISTQVGSFGSIDATKIHNLAGKYRQGYGTPFDLDDLIDSTGINLDSINFVRIIDVVGTINTTYATYDSQGNIINDPYSTAFESGGFDLDAIGVINENKFVELETNSSIEFKFYPNPTTDGQFQINQSGLLDIYNINGEIVFSQIVQKSDQINISGLKNGVYFLIFKNSLGLYRDRLVIKQ